MIDDTLNATLKRLQSSAIECYKAIKDASVSPTPDRDVDFIAKQCMRLANLEGAILTLQQYAGEIKKYEKELQIQKAHAVLAAEQQLKEQAEATPTKKKESKPISGEDLSARSPTHRRTTKSKTSSTTKRSRKKKTTKDEK